MKIIIEKNNAINIIVELGKSIYICENLSIFYNDPNERTYFFKEGNFLFTIDELIEYKEEVINTKWLNEDLKNNILNLYDKAIKLMLSYSREVYINKIIEDDKWELILAC